MNRETKPSIEAVLHAYGHETPHSPRRGGWTKMRCVLPGHDDRRPSAAINIADNKWSCNACGLTEDSIAVIAREEGVSIGQAFNIAREKFGAEDDRRGRTVRGVPRTRERLF